MEHPQVTAGISSLCQKIATPLQAFALPGEHEGDPSLWMDRLAAVFRCVGGGWVGGFGVGGMFGMGVCVCEVEVRCC